ncbi:hypothetical protein AAII07_44880 [Microvirga sp. 0TCS3.31]
MSLFKRRRFLVEIILLFVRWYGKYGISHRDLAEMMQERGVDVDPSTISAPSTNTVSSSTSRCQIGATPVRLIASCVKPSRR